jgi:hypothetical protein
MTPIEQLQAEFNDAKEQVVAVRKKITDAGYLLYNDNLVVVKKNNFLIQIETAFFGEYYDDYELHVSQVIIGVNNKEIDLLKTRLNEVTSLEGLQILNDQYHFIDEEYYYLSEQPLSFFYKKSDNEYELSGIDIHNTNAQPRHLKYFNIQFKNKDLPVSNGESEITVNNSHNYVYPMFYKEAGVEILCDFKAAVMTD